MRQGAEAVTIWPLIVDTYAGDLNGKTDIAAIARAGAPWCGWVGKASQGDYYSAPSWFRGCWQDATHAASTVDFWRGAYHYVDFQTDPTKQADFYLDAVGEPNWDDPLLLPPIVDVERGGQRLANPTKQQVVDCVSAVVTRLRGATGRAPILYGGSLLRDLGIVEHMGCAWLWIARYAAKLPVDAYASIGWTLDQVFAWQYAGDGESYLAGYPKLSPIGRTDISSVLVGNGSTKGLRSL